jgi:hypothetical protein
MLDEITWGQFEEWVTYAELSPFSAEREDYRVASVVQAIVNVNRDIKKKRKPYEIQDFVLYFGDSPKPEPKKEVQTVEQQKDIGRQYFLMFGGGSKNGPRIDRRHNSPN